MVLLILYLNYQLFFGFKTSSTCSPIYKSDSGLDAFSDQMRQTSKYTYRAKARHIPTWPYPCSLPYAIESTRNLWKRFSTFYPPSIQPNNVASNEFSFLRYAMPYVKSIVLVQAPLCLPIHNVSYQSYFRFIVERRSIFWSVYIFYIELA